MRGRSPGPCGCLGPHKTRGSRRAQENDHASAEIPRMPARSQNSCGNRFRDGRPVDYTMQMLGKGDPTQGFSDKGSVQATRSNPRQRGKGEQKQEEHKDKGHRRTKEKHQQRNEKTPLLTRNAQSKKDTAKLTGKCEHSLHIEKCLASRPGRDICSDSQVTLIICLTGQIGTMQVLGHPYVVSPTSARRVG